MPTSTAIGPTGIAPTQTTSTATQSAISPKQQNESNFDSTQAGNLPNGAQVFSGTWVVRAEADSQSQPNALCQVGSATFPAISLDIKAYTDVIVKVDFKAISGQSDQAAGIIFRIQDKDNYYIVRANALENSVVIFKYVNGGRSEIKGGSVNVANGKWQTLRMEAKGDLLRGYLNDVLIVEASDSTFSSGGVGLWTKADSVTCFDNVTIGIP